MTKMDLESVRQFILSDEEIKEYFLSLAGRESSMQPDGGAGRFLDRVPTQNASPENALEKTAGHTDSEYAVLEKNLQALKEENDALRSRLDGAQERADALEGECSRLQEAAAQAQAQSDAAAQKLAVFEPICSAMDVYNSLDEKSKEATKNIFRTASPDGFISCGAQKDSLANLWDYGRTLAAYGSQDCLKIDWLFGYFVSLYNLTFEQPVYTLIEPQTGDRFDEDVHVCLTRGKRISAVSGVLLRGYRVNGKTVNKALVK